MDSLIDSYLRTSMSGALGGNKRLISTAFDTFPAIPLLEATASSINEKHMTLRSLYDYIRVTTLHDGKGLNVEDVTVISDSQDLDIRDIRRIVWTSKTSHNCELFIRRTCLIFSFDPIRAIITHNKVLILLPPAPNDDLLPMYHLLAAAITNWKLNCIEEDADDPVNYFEIYSFEILMNALLEFLSQTLSAMSTDVKSLVTHAKVSAFKLSKDVERIRKIKIPVTKLSAWMTNCRSYMENLCENSEDLALMNLSVIRQFNSIPILETTRAVQLSARIEELIETHVVRLNTMSGQFNHLCGLIQNAEDSISMRLDTNQNEILLVNTFLSTFVCGIGFGGYMAGVMGMNLEPSIENNISFVAYFISTFFIILVSYVSINWYLEKLGILPKRVKLNSKLIGKETETFIRNRGGYMSMLAS